MWNINFKFNDVMSLDNQNIYQRTYIICLIQYVYFAFIISGFDFCKEHQYLYTKIRHTGTFRSLDKSVRLKSTFLFLN